MAVVPAGKSCATLGACIVASGLASCSADAVACEGTTETSETLVYAGAKIALRAAGTSLVGRKDGAAFVIEGTTLLVVLASGATSVATVHLAGATWTVAEPPKTSVPSGTSSPESTGLKPGEIAGIVIGGFFALVALLIVLAVVLKT